MKPGHVVLLPLPVAGGGSLKLRPALILIDLPGQYQDILVCGISSRLDNLEAQWDERIEVTDADYPSSGLHRASSIRLSYLYSATRQEIHGSIGRLDADRVDRLRNRLAEHFRT
jgi:mRNA interferase MazF